MTYHQHTTVYNYFRHWQRLGVWQKIHIQLRHQVRESINKKEDPTTGIIDSQSVKTAEKKEPVRWAASHSCCNWRGRYMVMTVENKYWDVNAIYC